MDANKIARNAYRLMEAAARMAEKDGQRFVAYRIEDININANGYAEPGYGSLSGEDVIATGNWNVVDEYDRAGATRVPVKHGNLLPRLAEAFERLGIQIEWSDEWSDCSDCGKLFRTQGDSYSWQPSFAQVDDGYVCHECLKDHATDYLAGLEGRNSLAASNCNAVKDIDPAECGYVKVDEEYTSGWHPGQNDNPVEIAKELRDRGIERFLFNLDGNEQFAQHFSVYVHESEASLLSDAAPSDDDNENEDSSDEE